MSTEEFAQRVIAEYIWGSQVMFRAVDLICAARVHGAVVGVRDRADLSGYQVFGFRAKSEVLSRLDVCYALNERVHCRFHRSLEEAMGHYMGILAGECSSD